MGNREYYEKKLEVISTIKDSQIKKPHHIPVAIYIQEAGYLYKLALETKKIRDQAYTHLKEAVDEIRETGRYVFRQDKKRVRAYASVYRRHIKSKQKQKPKKKATK